MCLAVPSQVIATDGLTATVEAFGRRREVSLMLLADPPELGDFVLIQVGGFAYEVVEPQRAREALALIEQLDLGHLAEEE